jgi:threonine synthase
VNAISHDLALRCTACGATHPAALLYRCPVCSGILEVERRPEGRDWQRSDFVSDAVTLGEGSTPLRSVRASLLDPAFKGILLLKDETAIPPVPSKTALSPGR